MLTEAGLPRITGWTLWRAPLLAVKRVVGP
jgi:hypothetical protein